RNSDCRVIERRRVSKRPGGFMKLKRSRFTHASWVTVLSLAIIWALPCADFLSAQSRSPIDAGTTIQVRTNEEINARDDDGRIYTGYVEQDVTDRSGRIAIPRGSNVEMMVRRNSDNDVYLDLDSVNVNGRQFGVEAQSNVVENERKEGLGANQRTGKYVGGGAVLGAIIGAIAGGGKGAAIGAGAGAAAGAGTQVLTRGRSVRVPSESLLTFRLTEPLRAGVSNAGYY